MDTISRIARVLDISGVHAVALTKMFDLPWATLDDEALDFMVRLSLLGAKARKNAS